MQKIHTHTHTHTRARAHARTHLRTHACTHSNRETILLKCIKCIKYIVININNIIYVYDINIIYVYIPFCLQQNFPNSVIETLHKCSLLF